MNALEDLFSFLSFGHRDVLREEVDGLGEAAIVDLWKDKVKRSHKAKMDTLHMSLFPSRVWPPPAHRKKGFIRLPNPLNFLIFDSIDTVT